MTAEPTTQVHAGQASAREGELAKRVEAIAAPLRAAVRDTSDMQHGIDLGEVAIAVRRLDALCDDLQQGLVL